MPSEPIASEKVTIDRKIFFIDLKENQRGRFMKITEDVGGRRDTIMLPRGLPSRNSSKHSPAWSSTSPSCNPPHGLQPANSSQAD